MFNVVILSWGLRGIRNREGPTPVQRCIEMRLPVQSSKAVQGSEVRVQPSYQSL